MTLSIEGKKDNNGNQYSELIFREAPGDFVINFEIHNEPNGIYRLVVPNKTKNQQIYKEYNNIMANDFTSLVLVAAIAAFEKPFELAINMLNNRKEVEFNFGGTKNHSNIEDLGISIVMKYNKKLNISCHDKNIKNYSKTSSVNIDFDKVSDEDLKCVLLQSIVNITEGCFRSKKQNPMFSEPPLNSKANYNISYGADEFEAEYEMIK